LSQVNQRPEEKITTNQPEKIKKPKKRRGCLTALGIFVLVLLIAGIFFFNVPQKIGLVASPGERLLSQTPDREAAASLKAELTKAGINTQGISLYLFPEKTSDQNVLLAVLDSSQGFYFNNYGNQDAISGYLKQLADLDKSGTYHIERIVLDYKDGDGESLVGLTAPVTAIRKFSQGTMSRQDFMEAIEGQVNVSKLAEAAIP
jgi:hypothetical protein